MRTNTRKFSLALVVGLALFAGLTAVVLAGSFTPITVTDQTLTAPLANPAPSSFQPRYISGFGSDNSFTVFFEDRDAGKTISYASTTTGPTGLSASATATNIADTHFLVKDWPINVDDTDYAYRAWGSVGNNMQHHFYVSNNLTDWILVSTFTIPNAASFTDAHGWVYYGFHDVILLNGTYYAFAESNQSQTMLVRSTNGDDVWEAFASIGGRPGWGPLELPAGVSYGWTPSGSFVDLGHDRGYGKIHVDPRDSNFYLAVNTAAVASLPPADLEAAFINPANWTWHDGTTGPAANPILSETSEHDLRECWVVPNSDPDADWVIIYDANFGTSDGGKALGYATVSPPPPPVVEMASFDIDHAKVDFKKKPDDDKVRVQGKFELDTADGDDVDISEDVTVTVGPLSETITMVETGKKGDKWEYKRPKDTEGIIKYMTIDWKNGKFDIRIDDADLTEVTNPLAISIQIGDDVGSESILMREHKYHWDYKAEQAGPAAMEPLVITDEVKVMAYPNPVVDVHTATFQVMGTLAAEAEEIRVQIYDLSGRLVWEDAALGSELDWHTDSLSGDYLANGIYLYRVQIRIGGSWINQDIGKIAVLR